MKIRSSIILLSIISIFFMSCGGSNQTESTEAGDGTTSLSGEVKIDGSSTVYPISEAVAEEFRSIQPDVRVTVGLSGTGGGFKKFSRGETDINNASRPIKQGEIESCEANNIKYLQLSVAYDGLSVVVNPENDWVTDMTVSELKMMWEPAAQNTIKKWSQIRQGWPDQEFRLYGAGTESGTYDYFTEVIVGESHSSRGDYTASEDDNVLVQGVSTDKNALGFFGFAYYEENQEKLKLIGIDDQDDSNGTEAVKPSIETVKNSTYTPLSRPLYIYVNSEAIKRPAVTAFVRFYLENAGQLAEEVGFIPMTKAEYDIEIKKFEDFVTSHGK